MDREKQDYYFTKGKTYLIHTLDTYIIIELIGGGEISFHKN